MPDQVAESGPAAVDVLTVSYGELEALGPLIESLRSQTRRPRNIDIWHNGPRFEPAMRSRFGPDVTVHFTGVPETGVVKRNTLWNEKIMNRR